VGVASGVGIGAAWRYVPPEPGSRTRVELADASAQAAAELEALGRRLRSAGNEAEAAIIDAQAMMATDPELIADTSARIADGASVEQAILAAGAAAAGELAALDDEILAARSADVVDVAQRIARVARGDAPPRLERRSVALAADLPPSITVELDPALLAGVVLEGGTPTSHAAILARALGIPAVVGVAGLLDAATTAREVAVDGGSGDVVIDPEPAVRDAMASRVHGPPSGADDALRDEPLRTRDGHRLGLAANVARPDEVRAAVEAGAEAIGLMRTEFAFMGRPGPPDERVQRRAYASALRAAAGRTVVFRLLDAGGDKALPYLELGPQPNPFLGMRAIRLARSHPGLLVTQLRAVLSAADEVGAVAWIMAPMVADLGDVRLLRDLLARAQGGGPSPPAVRVGIMIELPSAVLVADQLAAEVDFLSIGTNDLTQYLLAADRTNAALADRQDPLHPALLRAVREVVAAAAPRDVPVAVCGEMAADPAGAVVLAGLGVGELSMEPRAFASVKAAMRRLSLAEAQELARAASDAVSAAEARRLVDERLATATS
jgi:phosphoenolpyruvate-protein phosphotransferase